MRVEPAPVDRRAAPWQRSWQRRAGSGARPVEASRETHGASPRLVTARHPAGDPPRPAAASFMIA
jgi:hypothetical protein